MGGWGDWQNATLWHDDHCAVYLDSSHGSASSSNGSSQGGTSATSLPALFVTAHLSDAQRAANTTGTTPAAILAVAGFKPAWGKSRFALNGNNFFGLHAPALYETGKQPTAQCCVQMAVFNSFYDSARSFVEKK